MWSKSCLHAFLKIPPFSPSHCAPKIALNEAPSLNLNVEPISQSAWKNYVAESSMLFGLGIIVLYAYVVATYSY